MDNEKVNVLNNTNNTIIVKLTEFQKLALIPGLNMGVPIRVLKFLKKCYPHIWQLFNNELLKIEGGDKKIYKDKVTGVSFYDDDGEKVPVTVAKKDGNNTPYVTGRTFKISELRSLGISNTKATKLVNGQPNGGYSSIEQVTAVVSNLTENNITAITEALADV